MAELKDKLVNLEDLKALKDWTLGQPTTAPTAEDIDKLIAVKTVSDGKVTEIQLVENNVLIAIRGRTTWDTVKAAILKYKVIYCYDTNNKMVFELRKYSTAAAYFQSVYIDTNYLIQLDNNGWFPAGTALTEVIKFAEQPADKAGAAVGKLLAIKEIDTTTAARVKTQWLDPSIFVPSPASGGAANKILAVNAVGEENALTTKWIDQYELPAATTGALGGIKVGTGLAVTGDGTLSVSGSGQYVDWSDIENTPTTIGGYGIADAKINGGTITLGTNSITPLTADSPLNPEKLTSGTAAINISGNAATATSATSAVHATTADSATSATTATTAAAATKATQDGNGNVITSTYLNVNDGVTTVKVGSTPYSPQLGVISLPEYPTVPTVGNGTLTIQKNSTQVGTFSANASSNKTINITETVQNVSISGAGNVVSAADFANNTLTLTKGINISLSGTTLTITLP